MRRYFEIERRSGGRVFVELFVENDNVITVGYFGKAPTVSEMKELLKRTGLWARGIELNRNRTSPFKIVPKVGLSGAIDFYIKYIKEVGEFGVRARPVVSKYVLHVSMEGKINKGINAWLGDVVLVLAQYQADVAAVEDEIKYIKEVTEDAVQKQLSDFQDPERVDWDAYFKE